MLTPTTTARAAAAFVEKWNRATLNERATAHEHFTDLCRLLGQGTPNELDPHGDFYRFEKPLTKVGGKAGFADVWYRHRFAWEYKTKGKYPNLQAAYEQLLIYKDDLENPPVLAACDIANFEIHIAFTGYKTRIETFSNDQLQTVSKRELLHLVFTDPAQLRPTERTVTVTEQAAAKLAQIAQMLERRGFCPDQVAAFFTKLLFAFFAEDILLLPDHLMSNSLKQTISHPEEFPERIRAVFRIMNQGGYFGPLTRVPRFNGGLFEDDTPLPLTTDEIHFLYEAAKLDWSQMEPAIFGTLFERSLDPSKRAQLGAHYTSKDDILLIVEPVLMAPLRREWTEAQQQVEALRPHWEAASGATRQRLQNRMEATVFDFMDRLATTRVLDPACGSGNFLYVALNQLKDLEKEVLVYTNGVGLTAPELSVSPAQLYGIEKNPYAAALAQVVVWIGYWQWLKNNGLLEVKEPILQTLDTIQCRDAILAEDEHGHPVEPEWPAADVVVGNPPFLGGKRLRSELGSHYIDAMFQLYPKRVSREADLVTYWFERARTMLAEGKAQRVGLLATNSIRGGANRTVLEHIKQSGDIFMAWSDRPWVLDGAAVRVSIVGFDNGTEQNRMLNGIAVKIINPDLTPALNLTQASRLTENANIHLRADEKGGAFEISDQIAQEMIHAPVDAYGRSNSDVLRHWVTATDITKRPRNMWIIDFGIDMAEKEAAQYALPFRYIEHHVKPQRATNNIPRLREQWWLHRIPGANMRTELLKLKRYIATPVTAKYRLFVWIDSTVLPDITVTVFAREDDYFFGILHSKIHQLWSLRMGGWMGVGNDPRYTPSTTFETFPFPWAPGHEPQDDPRVIAIAEAARDLVAQRDAWLNPNEIFGVDLKQRTLTNLYNQRPDWLDLAHRRLDEAVCAAYGWPDDLSDVAILERLLELNLERASVQ